MSKNLARIGAMKGVDDGVLSALRGRFPFTHILIRSYEVYADTHDAQQIDLLRMFFDGFVAGSKVKA